MKKVIIIALSLSLILSGCSFLSFNDEEAIPTYNAPSLTDITETDPLSVEDALTSESGGVIATYEAFVPQFAETGERKEALRRINSYYASEIRALSQDMAGFFAYIDTLPQSGDAAYVTVDYEIEPCSPEFVCVSRTYSMYQNGVLTVHPSCQLFLTDTGWRLSFSALFGENSEKALELLKTSFKEWCKIEGLPDLMVDEITEEYLSNRFGINDSSLFICTEPFFLLASDPESHVVAFPLSSFSPLFN